MGNFRICKGCEGLSGPGGVGGYNGCGGSRVQGVWEDLRCRGLGM